MKPFRLAAGAPEDVQSAYDFYAQRSRTAAERFLATYLLTRDQIVARPLWWHVRPHEWCQATIQTFPRYANFYQEKKAFWLVAAETSTVQDSDNVFARLLIREVAEETE